MQEEINKTILLIISIIGGENKKNRLSSDTHNDGSDITGKKEAKTTISFFNYPAEVGRKEIRKRVMIKHSLSAHDLKMNR